MRASWFTVVGLALLALVALGGCNTPSVPIPPPSPDLMSFELQGDDGTAQFSYQENADFGDAVVYVFNRDVGSGVITVARPDGSVGPTQPFPAAEGDEVVVTFELELQLASTCIRVAPGQGNQANECSP